MPDMPAWAWLLIGVLIGGVITAYLRPGAGVCLNCPVRGG